MVSPRTALASTRNCAPFLGCNVHFHADQQNCRHSRGHSRLALQRGALIVKSGHFMFWGSPNPIVKVRVGRLSANCTI